MEPPPSMIPGVSADEKKEATLSPIQPARPADLEAGPPKLTHSTSRASLPLSRHHSFRAPSNPSTTNLSHASPDDGHDEEEEYTWGPSHPCYPHMNPHVPPDSKLYRTTRIIRIQRDWMQRGDLAPTFANLYPEVLDPYITEQDFREIITRVNQEVTAAFNPYLGTSWMDAILGVLTGWVYNDVFGTVAGRRLKALETWIADWNRKTGAKDGVKIMPLTRTGYLTIDVQIPDPQISDVDHSRPPTRATTVEPPATSHTDNPLPALVGQMPDLNTLRQGGAKTLPQALALSVR